MRIESVSLAVTNKIVTTNPMSLDRVQGIFRGSTADRFLQLFNLKALPADGVVPLRQWPLYMAAPFDQNFQNDSIALSVGCVFAVSTSDGFLTISADTMDIYVNGLQSVDTTGTTAVGDYTTGVASRSIWATGTANRLRRLEFTALTAAGATLYAKIFGKSTGLVAGDMPIWQGLLVNNTTKEFPFSRNPQWGKAGSIFNGCFVVIDSTAGAYVGSYAGTDFAIKGTYE